MNDTLAYMGRDPIHRRFHHDELTFSLVYAFSENYVLPLSHDEVVHGKGSLLEKMPGDRAQKLANVRALYGYMWAHPGKKLLFMGDELAQEREWDAEGSVDWHLLEREEHRGVQRLVRDLNRIYRARPGAPRARQRARGVPLARAPRRRRERGRVRALLARGRPLVCICNFSAEPRPGYRVGAAAPRCLARGAEHRRDRVRRLGRRESRARRRGRDALARPAVLRRGDPAAARGRLARSGGLMT